MDKKLTSSLEDYIEIIYKLIEKNNSVKAIDISKALRVSRASVTEALKKLNDKGLINYGRYDVIRITDEGITAAKEVIEKHQCLYNFFAKVLGATPEESEENACKIEHIISEDILNRIANFTDNYLSKHKKN